MANIGGNIKAVLRRAVAGESNAIGERETVYENICEVVGWLGLQSGDSKRTFNAKIEESTHVFLCDYNAAIYALTMTDDDDGLVLHMVIKGMVYDVLLIDNPDEMNEQLEIYLRKVGAWNG